MEDILNRARELQRKHADSYTVAIKLSTLQDLIAEIERLRPLEAVEQHNKVRELARGF